MKSWYLLGASVPTAIGWRLRRLYRWWRLRRLYRWWRLDAAEYCNQNTQARNMNVHVETGRDGAISVYSGLNGIHSGEVRGGAGFDAVPVGG